MEMDKLDSLKSQLRENKHFTTGDLFKELEKCYTECSLANNKYPIRKTKSLRQYNRLIATYNKNHYSKFYVPVWAADHSDTDEWVGYVLYPPELKPLTSVLEKIGQDFDKLVEVARLCFSPIAFAVDALHESTNRRSGYFHRDICVDNVYLPWKDFNGEPKYGEAKLMLTENTRRVYDSDYFDTYSSTNEKPVRAYFSFPDDGDSYEKKFDWYSFGIYIFEVLRTALIEEGKISSTWREYLQKKKTAKELKEVFQTLQKELRRRLAGKRQPDGDEMQHKKVEALELCLDIAVRCIDSNPAEGEYREKRYAEWPDTDTHPVEGLTRVYCLEHKVNAFTAELFALYRQIGDYLGGYHDFFDDARVQDGHSKTCDACLLREPDNLPLKTYWKGALRRQKTGDSSEFVPSGRCTDDDCSPIYCSPCYKSGERLFCPKHRAPASPIIGPNCYALVLYGNDFYKGNTKEQHKYQYDACRLVNTLMHLEVRGIPCGNIVRRALYDSEGTNCETLLAEACREMYNRIHLPKKGTDCTNISDYHLIIYYSGHGKNPEEDLDVEDGSWAPMATKTKNGKWDKHWISNQQIQEYTQYPRGFLDNSKPEVGCTNCFGSCTAVLWIMDHCETSEDPPKVCKRIGEEKPISWVVTACDPVNHRPKDEFGEPYSDVIYLISEILRSNDSKGKAYLAKSVSTITPSSLPRRASCHSKMKEMTMNREGDVEITIFDHHCRPNAYRLYFALAYDNPGGTTHRVLSMEDRTPYPIPSTWEICDHKTVSEEVLKAFNKKMNPSDGAKAVTLLSSATNDHSLYSLLFDSEVQSCLDASSRVKDNRPCANAILYFAAVYNKVKVRLIARNEECQDEYIYLNLDQKEVDDTLDLTHDIALERPNILVHVVHHFYMLWNDVVKGTQKSVGENLAWLVNNFAGHLFEKRKDLDLFDEDTGAESKWMELAHEAGSRRQGKMNMFKVENNLDIPDEKQITISWPHNKLRES